MDRLRAGLSVFYRELVKFGIVGAAAFVIDLGIANLLWHTVLSDKVTTARVIAGLLATLFAWYGNRVWTFRRRDRHRGARAELALFVVVNAVALGISTATLVLTHYGLGLDTVLADNASTVLGIALGTLFRFWAYRRYVFPDVVGSPPGAPTMARGTAAAGSSAASDKNKANTAG